MMKKGIFIIGLLLIAVGIFEFHPAVEYSRAVVPEEVYVGKDCDCGCIMSSRPWYSRFNYWFWLWIVATPVIVFSVKPTTPRWQRSVRTVVAIGFCYGIMNLALRFMWDIKNGPFGVNNDYPWQKSWDDSGVKCANIADGASLVFTLFFGWIYAMIYTGWWEVIWYKYYKRKAQLIDKDFRRDWISKITVWVSKYITIFVFLIIALMPFAFAGLHILEFFGLLGWYKSLFL